MFFGRRGASISKENELTKITGKKRYINNKIIKITAFAE